MRTFVRLRLRIVAAAAAVVLVTTVSSGQQQDSGLEAAALRTAIARALTTAPRGFQTLQAPSQAGVQVRDVAIERTAGLGYRVTVDLSQRALTWEPSGDVEVLLDHVVASTAALTAGARDVEYRILVDGLPLDQLLPRAVANRTFSPRQAGATGRVVISAGHGWYRHDASNSWRLQRDYYWGIVEDFVNHDIVRILEAELKSAGLDVRPARHPDLNAGAGVSGYPRWQESAKYYVRDLGAPASVWDFGADDYAKDINSRPFYSNWIDSAVVVAVHNNGGGGSGTETWYDTTHAHQAESRRLAEIVNTRIVQAIRAHYNASWPDRGLRSCNGCKGENRLADRPAIIVEVAFMDTRSPDNDSLKDDRFKQIVAQAIREALQEWGLKAPAPPPAPVVDRDATARRDIGMRASQDARFGAAIDGGFGRDLDWEAAFELRWMDFAFAWGREVRLYHSTRHTDGARFVGFWDPDSGTWRGWDPVQ